MDLDTFTEEILNGKLYFLCSDTYINHGFAMVISCVYGFNEEVYSTRISKLAKTLLRKGIFKSNEVQL